jgi:hypothetical protein
MHTLSVEVFSQSSSRERNDNRIDQVRIEYKRLVEFTIEIL